jgi:hypothetical protein
MDIMQLDPEWTAWAKCPYNNCKTVAHACCAEHCEEAITEHIDEMH